MIDDLKKRLQPLEPTYLDIIDDSHQHIGHPGNTGGGHYTIIIASPLFEGLSTLEKHRKVYACIDDLIPEKVHAAVIKIR